MTPSFFGRSHKALFGVYHQAAHPARSRAVLLCAPVGHEGVRSHRALRQLALLLGRARYHVLRFDYHGCGDSAGDSHSGHAAQWLEDISTAAAELKDMAGVGKVSFVGLRYGAALAALAARGRRDLDSLVLWDPVVSGRAHLSELRQMHLALMREELGDRLRALQVRPPPPGQDEEIMGFPLSYRCRRDLEQLDLISISDYPARKVAVVVSSQSEQYERLQRHLEVLPVESSFAHVPASWNSDLAMNHSLVPMDLLQTIVASLSEPLS